jgi:hypothetical protein
MPAIITIANRIIAAVGEHIVAQQTLACGCKCISIDESANLGIVITGLQVIEPGILGAEIATRSFLALSPLVFKNENQGRIVRL